MSIVEQNVVHTEEPQVPPVSLDYLQSFCPSYLAAVNDHPLDDTIQSLPDGTFFVRDFTTHTLSVSSLLPHASTKTPAGRGDPTTRRRRGVHLHRWIECILNGFPMVASERVHQQVLAYYAQCLHGKVRPWRTEMAIRSRADLMLVGVVDALFVSCHPEPSATTLALHLKDWKYSVDVSACWNDYVHQLNYYKFILESAYGAFHWDGQRYDGLRVVSMELVVFHESTPTHRVHPVPDIQTEVRTHLEQRKKGLK
jgi:hypothetical protein